MNKKWILWPVLTLCILIAAATALFILQENRYTLTMTHAGESKMAVELGQVFEDPGVMAQGHDLLKGQQSVSVIRSGYVDTNAIGVYRLRYKAIFRHKVCTFYRDVHVVESLAPHISLVSDPLKYTLPNAAYEEEGFIATDWYDGDLTAQVRRTEEDGMVTYTVTNSLGFTTTVQRQIRYDDPIPPEILLEGDAELFIPAGKTFQDPGFRATDNVDGDLTELVQVSGAVDVYRPDVYPITYTVWDRWGNSTTVTRNVTVTLDATNSSVPTDKVIYLTFDDGPGQYTEHLLDILEAYNVKATFFLVNTSSISLAERIAEDGHTIGIHTATHKYAQIYASEEAFFEDLLRMQTIIADTTGQTTYLMRFPGGSSNVVSKNYCKGIMTTLTDSVKEKGFFYFDWNVDSKDAGGAKTPEEVFENVIKGIEKHDVSVVLQHDIYEYSIKAVEKIIVWGLSNGYTFLPLTETSPSCAHDVNN